MNELVAVALLVGGVVLIIFGVQAMNSFSSDISRFLTGSMTNKAVWMFMGGSLAALVGLAMTLRSPKHS